MKRIKSWKICLVVAMFVMAMSSVAFAGAQDFTLVNQTGFDIYMVNVTPADSDDWQNDILGKQVLGNGQYCIVTFAPNGKQYWDILVTFQDDSTLEWYDIDLLSVARVTLNGDGTASFD